MVVVPDRRQAAARRFAQRASSASKAARSRVSRNSASFRERGREKGASVLRGIFWLGSVYYMDWFACVR